MKHSTRKPRKENAMLKFGLKSKCFALVAAALMAGGVSAAEKIRVASEGTFAPFEFMNSKTGQLEGFEIDLVKALCAKMGKEPEITMYKFDGILPAVLSNTVDFAAAGFAITEERKKKVLFTDPFYKSGITVILPAKSDLKIEKFEDLKGKSISVQMGSISHDKAKTIPDAQITTFDQSPDAILNMIQGGSDAAINSLASTDYMIATRPALAKQVKRLDVEQGSYMAMVVPKNRPETRDALNKALKEIMADGTYDKIHEKWFGRPATWNKTPAK